MSRPKHPQDCDNGEQLETMLEHDPRFQHLRTNGSHSVWKLPNGELLVNVRGHRKPFGKGLKCALVKALAAFFPIILLIVWYQVYLA